jgi:hypothetical protein
MKLGLLLLAISSLLTASDKPPTGEITNPQALAKVRSFCVDTEGLNDFDRHLLKDFLKAESKPKHLLAKLPWKLVPACEEGASDAAAKVEFVPLRVINVGLPRATPGQEMERPYATKVALQIVDANSREALYSVEAGAVMNAIGPADSSASSPASDNTNPVLEQKDALYHAFWALVDDVRQLQQHQRTQPE